MTTKSCPTAASGADLQIGSLVEARARLDGAAWVWEEIELQVEDDN